MIRVLLIQVVCILLLLSEGNGQTFPRWLAIGDSITLHGPKADLQWLGEPRGMAASEVSKDYVHVLHAKLRSKDSGNAAELKIVGRIGKLSGGTIEQMNSVLEELRDWKADLVTVQLGENDRLSEIRADGFEKRYRMLVDALLNNDKKPIVVCTGVWAPGQSLDPIDPSRYKEGSEPAIKDGIIERVCREKGLRFVGIAPAAAQRGNFGSGGTDGVKWHPNDAGMQAYALAIYSALYSD